MLHVGRWTTVFKLTDTVAEPELWGRLGGQLLETANDGELKVCYLSKLRNRLDIRKANQVAIIRCIIVVCKNVDVSCCKCTISRYWLLPKPTNVHNTSSCLFLHETFKNAKAKRWLALPSHFMATLRKLIVNGVPY